MTNEIKFSELCGFFDKQWQATMAADTHRFTLYGGAKGPGKSYWLRWYPIRWLLQMAALGFRNMRAGLFCETYPSLADRQISKIETEFPQWLGTLQETHANGLGFYLRPQYGGGILLLRNLDDPQKYSGGEFGLQAVDELTRNPMRTFDILRSCNRWPGLDEPRFIAGTNPDGIGQKWVRSLWIEHKMPKELAGWEDRFEFVPGLATDNKHLSASYWEELKTQSGARRKAWLEGDWYASFEGLVYEDFRGDLVDGNLTMEEPDPDLPIELAFDDGYVDPRAILFVQRKGSEILVFDEMYHRKHLPETCVREVVEKCGARFGWVDDEKTLPKRLPQISVGSPEAKVLQEHLRRANIVVRFKPHKIREGIEVVRSLICDGNGYRTLKIHTRCTSLIEEITSGYQYPEGGKGKDEEPVDKENHAVDALRYWAFSRGH